MNPLSMIQARSLTSQMLQGLPTELTMPGGKAGAIPQSEIEKLSPNISAPAVKMPETGGAGFENVFSNLVTQVNQKQIESKDMVNGLLTGKDVSLHQAVIAMEEASVSFQLMTEVRNKLLESYQELMRMQM